MYYKPRKGRYHYLKRIKLDKLICPVKHFNKQNIGNLPKILDFYINFSNCIKFINFILHTIDRML